MKKSVKRILAVALMLALALCVLSGCSDDTQAKIDAAVKTATDALTKEKDEALAAAQTAAEKSTSSAAVVPIRVFRSALSIAALRRGERTSRMK